MDRSRVDRTSASARDPATLRLFRRPTDRNASARLTAPVNDLDATADVPPSMPLRRCHSIQLAPKRHPCRSAPLTLRLAAHSCTKRCVVYVYTSDVRINDA